MHCFSVLEELPIRLERRWVDEKQNHSRRERISDFRCICGNITFFTAHKDKVSEHLEDKCVIGLSLVYHSSSKYLNEMIWGFMGNFFSVCFFGDTECFQLIILLLNHSFQIRTLLWLAVDWNVFLFNSFIYLYKSANNIEGSYVDRGHWGSDAPDHELAGNHICSQHTRITAVLPVTIHIRTVLF